MFIKNLVLNFIILVVLVIFTIGSGCSKKEKIIQVIPGQSIAGVELGASKDQVLTRLGNPHFQVDKENVDKFVDEFKGVLGEYDREGRYEKWSPDVIGEKKMMIYTKPPVFILLDEYESVIRITLSYCKNLVVEGFPFLKFNSLSLEQISSLGEPSSMFRAKEYDKELSKDRPGEIWVNYEYFFDDIGLNLGLAFNKTKQARSQYFIGINHINVYPPE
jgi:hypothetical protein